AADAAGRRARGQTGRERLMGARILIVDDEEIVIRSCLRILDGNDYQIEVAHDGHDALRKVEDNPYDVMILDIMMPNLGGLEVLRRVKEAHPDMDVIMITGLSQIDTAVQAMKLGAFDYISKPFEPADAGGLSPRRAMRAHQFNRLAHRGKRNRQGVGRPRYPLQQFAQGQAVCSGGLQFAEREPRGKRAVRSRQGRLYRRNREQERHV